MRLWLERRADFPVIGPWLTNDIAVILFAWGGLIFDLLIVPALLWRRTRLLAYLIAVGFHLANSQLWNIGNLSMVHDRGPLCCSSRSIPSEEPCGGARCPLSSMLTRSTHGVGKNV